MNKIEEKDKIIKKLLDCSDCKFAACETCEITYTDRKNIKEYIEQLKAERIQAEKNYNYYDENGYVIEGMYKEKGKIELIEEMLFILKGEEK